MRTVNPRSITDAERPWLDAWSLPVQVQLLNLVKARVGNEVALSMAGWLTAKHDGQDLGSMATRARYRKILRELAAEGVTPDPSSSSARRNAGAAGRRASAGSVTPAAATAVALGSSLAALAVKSPALGVAGVGVLALVYITDSPGDEIDDDGDPVQKLVIWPGEHVSGTCRRGPAIRVGDVSKAA